jgi:hypothetical protein
MEDKYLEVLAQYKTSRNILGKVEKPFYWFKTQAASFIKCIIVDTTYINRFNQYAVFLIVDSDNEIYIGQSFAVSQETHFLKALPRMETSGMLQEGALVTIKIDYRGNPIEVNSKVTKIEFEDKTWGRT